VHFASVASLVTMLGFSLTRWFIGHLLWTWRAVLLVCSASWIIEALATLLAKRYLGPARTIERRYAWMFYDLLQLPAQMVVGLMTALMRVAVLAVLALVALPRLDASLYPQWINDLCVFDWLAASYRATLLLHHRENSPMASVFVHLLVEASRQRAASQQTPDPWPKAGSQRLRVANRWRKCALIVTNPMCAVVAVKAVERVPGGREEDQGLSRLPSEKKPKVEELEVEELKLEELKVEELKVELKVESSRQSGSAAGRASLRSSVGASGITNI